MGNKLLICLKKIARFNILIITNSCELIFVIYTDFESNLKQFQKPDKDNTDAENDNADESYTDKYQEHIV